MADHGGERLGLGDSLEVVVLVDDGPPQVVVRPRIRDVVVTLEDPALRSWQRMAQGCPTFRM